MTTCLKRSGEYLTQTLIASVCILLVAVFPAFAQLSKYEVTKVNQHVYILSYPYSPTDKLSIGVIIGDQGVTLINTMMRNTVDELQYTLSTLTNKPVRYVINSNYDWWSTSANQYFAERGATIIAHRDTQYMSRNFSQLLFDDTFELNLGTEQLFAYRSGGHSFGHINIVLKQANLVWLADSIQLTWPTTFGPNGLDGYRKGLESALSIGNNNTQYVTGSSSNSSDLVVDANKLERELSARTTFYRRAQTLISQNKTNQEIIEDPELVRTLSFYSNPSKHKLQEALINRVRFSIKQDAQRLTELDAQHYLGQFKAPDGTLLQIDWYQGKLVAKVKDWFIVPLVATSESQFIFDAEQPNSFLEFSTLLSGKYNKVTLKFATGYQGYLIPLNGLEFQRL